MFYNFKICLMFTGWVFWFWFWIAIGVYVWFSYALDCLCLVELWFDVLLRGWCDTGFGVFVVLFCVGCEFLLCWCILNCGYGSYVMLWGLVCRELEFYWLGLMFCVLVITWVCDYFVVVICYEWLYLCLGIFYFGLISFLILCRFV